MVFETDSMTKDSIFDLIPMGRDEPRHQCRFCQQTIVLGEPFTRTSKGYYHLHCLPYASDPWGQDAGREKRTVRYCLP
ncbi:MAG: DUF2175 family protein [Candidatus Hodarchaeota archaeon]